MKPPISPIEAADVIDRFIEERSKYPDEWNDFVGGKRVDPRIKRYRDRCYELDPLVNRPGPMDIKAVAELKEIASILRGI
jgi:hypothetical protein